MPLVKDNLYCGKCSRLNIYKSGRNALFLLYSLVKNANDSLAHDLIWSTSDYKNVYNVFI